tara:strand:- start:5028 stop:5468 length:441 start_codon:yes stop_codon:yes gene_type:complete
MEISIFSRLPEEVIVNHIMPFAYKIQKKELLKDIQYYNMDLNSCRIFYDWNSLLRDMIHFINLNLKTRFGRINAITIFKRIYALKDKSDREINEYINKFSVLDKDTYVNKRKARQLFGLLNRYERVEFFNVYVLSVFNVNGHEANT